MDKWSEKIDSDESAYFFLSQLISSRVEQEISKKLKEADPFFGKILRSVNYVIEKNGYAKKSYFGVIHIVENESVVIDQLPPDFAFIEFLPNSVLDSSNKKNIDSIFNFIKTTTDYFPAIPLNAFIKRIKEFHASGFSSANYYPDTHIDEQLDVEKITNQSLQNTFNRIHNFYVAKNKMTLEESLIYKKVLADYADDLKDGGVSRGLYEYFNAHMNNLTRDDYYKLHYHNLDYLIRLLKKGILEKLESI